MTNEQIQTRIDVALELLEALPVLALANHEKFQEFVNDMPAVAKWSDARWHLENKLRVTYRVPR